MRPFAPEVAQFCEVTPLPGIKIKVENLDTSHELILVDQAARSAFMDLSHPAIRGRRQGVYLILIGCDAPQCPYYIGLCRLRNFTNLHAYDLLLLRIDFDRAERGGGQRIARQRIIVGIYRFHRHTAGSDTRLFGDVRGVHRVNVVQDLPFPCAGRALSGPTLVESVPCHKGDDEKDQQ